MDWNKKYEIFSNFWTHTHTHVSHTPRSRLPQHSASLLWQTAFNGKGSYFCRKRKPGKNIFKGWLEQTEGKSFSLFFHSFLTRFKKKKTLDLELWWKRANKNKTTDGKRNKRALYVVVVFCVFFFLYCSYLIFLLLLQPLQTEFLHDQYVWS